MFMHKCFFRACAHTETQTHRYTHKTRPHDAKFLYSVWIVWWRLMYTHLTHPAHPHVALRRIYHSTTDILPFSLLLTHVLYWSPLDHCLSPLIHLYLCVDSVWILSVLCDSLKLNKIIAMSIAVLLLKSSAGNRDDMLNIWPLKKQAVSKHKDTILDHYFLTFFYAGPNRYWPRNRRENQVLF